jgi:acylphosphatase
MEQTAKHVIFSGEVQGVGFRYTTNRIAGRYSVAGYVRNRPDGTVEMFLQGPSLDVNACLQDIQDAFAGYIRETRVEEAAYDARLHGFRITF